MVHPVVEGGRVPDHGEPEHNGYQEQKNQRFGDHPGFLVHNALPFPRP